MSSPAPDLTQDQIEEEIDFIGIQIDTLDPGADDYQDDLTKLQTRQQLLQARLQHPQQLNDTSFYDDTDAKSITHSRGVHQWETALGSSEDVARSTSDNGSIATMDSQDHSLSNGPKRARPTSHFLVDEPLSKRPTPERVSSGPSSLSSASGTDLDRARRRHEAVEASLRRDRDLQRKDADYARQISEAPGSPAKSGPSASSSFSSQTRTQTTLNRDGGYHRLPPIKTLMDMEPLSTPNQSYDSRARTLPWHVKPSDSMLRYQPRPFASSESNYTKQELPRSSQYSHMGPSFLSNQKHAHTSGHPTAVVDLTGSDSDDMEVKEVGSRMIAPEYGAPGPSRPSSYSHFGSSLGSYHVAGAYPGGSEAYPKDYQNSYTPSQRFAYARKPMPIMNSKSRSMQTGHQMSTEDLHYLISGHATRNPRTDVYIDSGDEFSDEMYDGQHHMRYSDPGTDEYAGRRDLYDDRFNMLANYDSTKSKEEIEALLKNIRPDEDMPAHLRVKTPDSMTIKLHKYQELGLTWLQKCEDGSNKGGILADDMGLGKTIQMLSLMVTRKSQDPRCKTTLIIAPVALMRQWKQEIQQKIKTGANHQLTVYIHHGPTKKKDFRDLQLFDVVLTTYGSLAVEVKKMEAFHARRHNDPNAQPYPKEKCVLIGEDARWYRVILDEAQCIKNKSTQTSKGACLVNAKYRWCMSGTPMMNSVEELFSLIRFLRIRPYNQWEKFRLDFKMPLQGRESSARGTAMRRLQTLCKAIMLRRTKKSTFEGMPILVLPERTTEVDNPEFSEDERDLYQALETQSQLQFNKYLRAGTVGKSYTAILVLLLRLRQACCHPHLINDLGVSAAADLTEDQMLEMAKELSESAVARIKISNATFECPVCYDITPNPAIFIPCGHDACSECFAKLTDPAEAIQNGEEGSTRFKCPTCRGPIDPKRVTDFASFKKVYAPDMFTEQEIQAMQAEASDQEDSESEDDDDDDDGDDNTDEDEQGDTADDHLVKADRDNDDLSLKAEDDLGADDLDTGVKTQVDRASTFKHEEKDASLTAPPHCISKGKSKVKAKTTNSKAKGKGQGKGKKAKKEKKKKKKVKAAMTLAELKKRANKNLASRKEYVRRIRKDWITSAKIEKTMDILKDIMRGEDREKVLVFSQWTSLLDLLEVPIDDAGYGYRRYDGSMNARMRGDAVDDFRDDSKAVRIMLVSLKAGNAGLNLNMASQVIILDPFWNPYIEEQAIDRAHRIGQRLPVKVHRVLIENTVEDRILGIQEKKRALISEALDEQAGQSLSRLGVQELAYLFGVTHSPAQQVNYVPRERRG